MKKLFFLAILATVLILSLTGGAQAFDGSIAGNSPIISGSINSITSITPGVFASSFKPEKIGKGIGKILGAGTGLLCCGGLVILLIIAGIAAIIWYIIKKRKGNDSSEE
jgi:hypothetical protein